MVLDDMAWADHYKHIMPTNVVASPYATQYAGPQGAGASGTPYGGGGGGGGAMPGVYSV